MLYPALPNLKQFYKKIVAYTPNLVFFYLKTRNLGLTEGFARKKRRSFDE